ncbi:GNAT family N-acetyltransferase [Corynebacterium aquatimens]|uniref:RimJ/RimL family protein N-acetyltransferase n=1 Tax=Corynebacterium aquatimens TaxID=1190508 RepID=A0A931E131_9CORY|nr:GNAT family protein [Corynebacterium aquatimens]MBG6121421.1 RimJ/RimL family protein N-acetyltransferase [Corynebacterium aquatimens]WJY66035.1 Putative ribosomal N-acetyltransferase YdaF [Corynebacterium aquatimens]
MPDFPATPTMRSKWATLEPLSLDHADGLAEAVGDLSTLWYQDHIPAPEDVPSYISSLISESDRAAWAIIAPDGRPAGVTTYFHLDPVNRNLEIGSTWIGKEFQGTSINPAVKYLMLERAFEELGCLRVEIRTHFMNQQSRRAIEKLGAKLDGVLRRHKVLKSGLVRDTCVYSILDTEWPEVQSGLVARLGGRPSSDALRDA